ncbi:DUF402 domain-containing protein [Streptomyces sp. NPDC058440]|uniref:DUF402 domain-containing protein n=1 Tax=Streptomyces sp. NPDC058440 TaxID=3346501 RepID=UPI003654216E
MSANSAETGGRPQAPAEVDVVLVKGGRVKIRYRGVLVSDDGTRVTVRAGWAGEGVRDFGFVRFEPGDVFTEHYWRDRWYSVKEVRTAGGALKGWYCDVTRPATRSGTDLVPRQATFAPSRRPARPLAAPAESPSTSSTRTSGRHAESTHRTPLLYGQTLPAAALVVEDLDLDLWRSADGTDVRRLDEDEFEASGLARTDPGAAAAALAALDELEGLAREDGFESLLA